MWGLRRDLEPTLVDRLYQQGLLQGGGIYGDIKIKNVVMTKYFKRSE